MKLRLKNVRVHNLKGVDLEVEKGELTVFTGVSGSGKSSLAFDTIYVEGQRRYIESLGAGVRRQLGDFARPAADKIEGIAPTIAVEQKTIGKNPRSTVGTITGIYDYLRVLFARIGKAHCPISGESLSTQSEKEIIETILAMPEKSKLIFLAPFIRGKKGTLKEELDIITRRGFLRIRLDGEIVDLSEPIEVNPKKVHDIDLVVDRISLGADAKGRVTESVSNALNLGKGIFSVENVTTKTETLFSKFGHAKKSGASYPPLEPHDFSFNHPKGMCPACEGLGLALDFDLEKIIDEEKSLAEGCCKIAGSYNTVKWGNIYNNLADLYDFSVHTPWKDLKESTKNILLYGSRRKWIRMKFVHPQKGTVWTDYVKWRGFIADGKKRLADATSDVYKNNMAQLMTEGICPECHGSKILPYPAAAKLFDKKIHEVTALTVDEAKTFFGKQKLTKEEEKIGGELLLEVCNRLKFLSDVGLGYLSLERTSPTLSGGEAQRVRLASALGSGLVGATYVLDEPSIGLHARDNEKLIETLLALRDKGNTVLVVEHDEETILSADTVVDVGPGAGSRGGEIIFHGPPKNLETAKNSATADYLFGRKKIPIPKKRRKGKNHLVLEGAKHHNLKEVTLKIPLGTLTGITGVSGSGKSSLILDTLFPLLANELHRAEHSVGKHKKCTGIEHIDKVIGIDQSPIGRTPRSNPATYIKLFDDIRDLFAKLPEAKARGYMPGRFSFNVKEGSCHTCGGMGQVRIDMDFMEDAWQLCETCQGKRFDPQTLEIHYSGKSIYDILSMTVEAAATFFEDIPHIKHKLDLLLAVGLGYLEIGQSSVTLSGGEAQRIKLAKELVRPSTGHTLYIFDEPTTGLHFDDIAKLIEIMQRLVDEGNTIVVIEHNLDLIKVCDHLVDLGLDGGKAGGEIIATGTPEKLAKCDTPTGKALQKTDHKIVPATKIPATKALTIKEASQHNLKNLSLEIPLGKMTVCCGPSGSGKSSLAFDTVYAEGQRRYTDTLSPYARQFIKQMAKPSVRSIEGLAPAIAIEQKHHAGNPRSTVGTMTEIYDYLRILYAHAGVAYCPETGEKIESISPEYVCEKLMELPEKTRLTFLQPTDLADIETIAKRGYLRIRLNGEIFEVDQNIPFDPNRKNVLEIVIDRVVVKPGIEKRMLEAIEQMSGPFVVATPEEDLTFNLSFSVAKTGKAYRKLIPQSFSYNSEEGMCPDCQGLGFVLGADLSTEPFLLKMTPLDLMLELWKEEATDDAYKSFLAFCDSVDINAERPIMNLTDDKKDLLFNGSEKPFEWNGVQVTFRGIHGAFALLGKAATGMIKRTLSPLLEKRMCSACRGSRLKPLSRNVKLCGVTLPKLVDMPIDEAAEFMTKLKNIDATLDETLRQISTRLKFLQEIGLGYLSLFRSAPTLSGGETQRICLASALGAQLTGCLYVLDEPTIGLSDRETKRLLDALKKLQDLGNTLLLVEHDRQVLEMADHLIDFGPGAGRLGGEITAQGTLEQLKKNPASLTGQYLSGKKKIPMPEKKVKTDCTFMVENANLHNLKNLTVKFPFQSLICVTGVSGSGKSTLIHDILEPGVKNFLKTGSLKTNGATFSGLEPFKELISLSQDPIGHTIRADITTFTDLLTPLRKFFAELPHAKTKGLQPRHFSYNHKRGMCKTCFGIGYKSIELQYLPPVKVKCSACNGHRLQPHSLEVTYKGKNLGEILEMTATAALDFLPPIPKVVKILETLGEVGLSYLTLNQPIQTLSGGEAQRLRLSRELTRRPKGKTLYLFDEPTIGLHFTDIEKLLPIFTRLKEKKHTVIVIEHNPDIIARADHVITLGPDSGPAGGHLIESNQS